MDVSFDKLQELLPSQLSLFNYVHDLNWRERKLPTSGRGVSRRLNVERVQGMFGVESYKPELGQ